MPGPQQWLFKKKKHCTVNMQLSDDISGYLIERPLQVLGLCFSLDKRTQTFRLSDFSFLIRSYESACVTFTQTFSSRKQIHQP